MAITLREIPRLFDRKPWAAHLYVTDRCNLDCHYCNEYDNARPHPKTEDLKRWLGKMRDLGVLRVGLMGGEPLLHPDIVELVRHARHDLGFRRVSMATNAFTLTREQATALAEAGLTSLQISVDRMTPTASTRKSLETVEHKLDWFRDSAVRVQVAGVLFGDTVEEMNRVVERCVERGVRVHARLVHADLIYGKGVGLNGNRKPYHDFLDMEERRKLDGQPIHSNWTLLAYQRALLADRPLEWRCVGGYKYFFVSAEGRFWVCSQVRTEIDIMDVTPELLRSYDTKKECQDQCGVYCIFGMSYEVHNTADYLGHELKGSLGQRWRALRQAVRGAP